MKGSKISEADSAGTLCAGSWCARASLEKEDVWNAETFYWNPAGNQARPAKCADSRNRVLRGQE